jgi:uncharacterized protein (TIGR02996 family)
MSHNAFLDEIRADPEDTIPRLIYADWLEENGNPLAELIRVQCELAEMDVEADGRAALRQRERELLADYEQRFVQPLRKFAPHGIEIRRGFIEELRIDAQTFIEHASEIVELLPALCSLNLRKARKSLDELVHLPELQHVRFLDLRMADLGDAGIQKLLQSPHLRDIVELNLHGNSLSTKGVQALSVSDSLRNLRSLNLGANRLTVPACRALSMSPVLRDLQSLSLWSTGLNDKALARLAATDRLAGLTRLDVGSNRLSSTGIQTLANGPWNLLSLDAGYNEKFGVEAARFLANGLSMSELRHLRMVNVPMRLNGLAALLTSHVMTNLESVSIQHIGDLSARGSTRHLTEDVASPSLRIASLTYCRIHAAGLQQILTSGAFAKVEDLTLFGNYDLSEAGVSAITSSDQLTRLRRLDLGTCGFNARGLREISKWRQLPKLQSLNLSGNTYKQVSVAERLAEAVKDSGTRVTIEEPDDVRGKPLGSPTSKRWAEASRVINQGHS